MSFVEIEHPRPHVTLVTLNRPERMNAMAFDVMIPLRDALREISLDNDCRVVVITGAGHGFCSGADLVGGGMVPNIEGLKRTSIARRALKVLDDVILAIRDMHQPVIAAVNGAAIGGGFCLASAATSASRPTPRTSVPPASTTVSPRPSSGSATCCRARSGSPAPSTSCSPGATSTPPRRSASGWCRSVVAGDQLLERCYELADGHHRLQPDRRRAHEAAPLGELRRRQPPRPHEPRGQRAALRAHDHRQLRREDRRVEGRPHAGVHR